MYIADIRSACAVMLTCVEDKYNTLIAAEEEHPNTATGIIYAYYTYYTIYNILYICYTYVTPYLDYMSIIPLKFSYTVTLRMYIIYALYIKHTHS